MRDMQPTDTTEPDAPHGPAWFDTDVEALDRAELIRRLALVRQIHAAPATFGGPIAAALIARGTTQSALAAETGVSQPTISRWTRTAVA